MARSQCQRRVAGNHDGCSGDKQADREGVKVSIWVGIASVEQTVGGTERPGGSVGKQGSSCG